MSSVVSIFLVTVVTVETVGERIRRLREAKSLSRPDLAYKVGISPQGMAALENGESKLPSFAVGLKLAAALGASPWELAGEREPGTVSPLRADRNGPAGRHGLPARYDDLFSDGALNAHVIEVIRCEFTAPSELQDAVAKRFVTLGQLDETRDRLAAANDRIEALAARLAAVEAAPRRRGKPAGSS